MFDEHFNPTAETSSNPQTISSVIRLPEQSTIADISKPADTSIYNMEPRFILRILHSQRRKTVLWTSFHIFLPSHLLVYKLNPIQKALADD